MEIFIFLSIVAVFAIIANYFKTKEIKNLKRHIQNKGGEFIDLTWQPGIAFWRMDITRDPKNDYLLTYSDKSKNQHESLVSISVFGFKIISDKILIPDDKPSEKNTQKEKDIIETRIFNTTMVILPPKENTSSVFYIIFTLTGGEFPK